MLFQPFNKATRPETPGFADAELQEGIFKQKAKQQENALRSQNMMGAAEIYNAGMGDASPIADSLFGATPETAATIAETGAADAALATGTESALIAPTAAEAAGVASAAGGGTTAAVAPVAAAEVAGAGAAGAGAAGAGAGAGAAGTGALAAMGPVGWAALAGMALMAMG